MFVDLEPARAWRYGIIMGSGLIMALFALIAWLKIFSWAPVAFCLALATSSLGLHASKTCPPGKGFWRLVCDLCLILLATGAGICFWIGLALWLYGGGPP